MTVGVWKDRKKWRGYVHLQGRTKTLGSFDCEEEAARAVDRAIRKYDLDLSALNFPDEEEGGGDEEGIALQEAPTAVKKKRRGSARDHGGRRGRGDATKVKGELQQWLPPCGAYMIRRNQLISAPPE